MTARLTQGITDRQEPFRLLLEVLTGPIAVKIADALHGRTRPDLGEDDETDFLQTIRVLAGPLDGAMGRLITADHAVHDIQADMTTLREQRDDSATGVAAEIVGLRRHVQFQYKRPDLGLLGLYSPRSYRPAPLLRQANLIDDLFQAEDLDEILGEEKYEGGIHPRVPVAVLRQKAGLLTSTVEDLLRARRRLDVAIIEKNRLLDEYDMIFLNTARALEAYCRLAGLPKLAERIRPSRRRPGRLKRVPVETAVVTAEPPAATEADGAGTDSTSGGQAESLDGRANVPSVAVAHDSAVPELEAQHPRGVEGVACRLDPLLGSISGRHCWPQKRLGTVSLA